MGRKFRVHVPGEESIFVGDIKLFVCCHRPEQIAEHPLLVPVQVGAALSERLFPGFLYDNSGDHISTQNRRYCELTAQYWVWKNVQAEYCGFFHYRRYLYPDLHGKKLYCIKKSPDLLTLQRLGFDDFERVIAQYDLIAPMGENMYQSVREHYAAAPHHHGGDLALAERILLQRHPHMARAAEAYLSGSICYFGNLYIMKGPLFYQYCQWLFPILEEFDRQADVTGYGPQELRVDGYLAERLFGIYLTHIRHSGQLKVLELPRVHFEAGGGSRLKQRVVNAILPPGTRRRSVVKRTAKRRK